MNKFALIAPPVVVLALVGGLFAGEHKAHDDLDDQLRTAISQVVPTDQIRGTDVRGQPYVMSAYRNEISTGYVETAAPEGAERERLLVQQLDLTTDRARKIETILDVAYPAADAPLAPYATEVSPTLSGNGRTITYSAKLTGNRLTIRAAGGTDPAPMTLALFPGSKVTSVQATKEGLAVNVIARDVPLARAAGDK